jgi:hypothetical protein
MLRVVEPYIKDRVRYVLCYIVSTLSLLHLWALSLALKIVKGWIITYHGKKFSCTERTEEKGINGIRTKVIAPHLFF